MGGSSAPYAESGADLSYLVAKRRPDWPNARVLVRPDGKQVVAAPLSESALRAASDSLTMKGTAVFELEPLGYVRTGKILEFVISSPHPIPDLVHYLEGYWRRSFSAPLVAVAEFSLHYAPKRGMVFRLGDVPRETSIALRNSGYAKTARTCWYLIWCYVDPGTGQELWCDEDTITILWCEDGDDEGGGTACDCDDEIPCAMEKEYEDRGVSPVIRCEDFTRSGGSVHFSWHELNGGWQGGNESVHKPWGFINAVLTTGLEWARVNYRAKGNNSQLPLPLSSGYRCPDGNATLPSSSPDSFHIQGRAADVPSSLVSSCKDVEDAFEEAGAHVVGCDRHADHIHGRW